MGKDMSDIARTMATELSARSTRERTQSSAAPAAVAAALSADAASLEFLARRHKEVLRLREEGEEKNRISGAELAAHAARGRMLIHMVPAETVCAASACGSSPCSEELRGRTSVSDKYFVFSTLSTSDSKLNI